VAQASSSVGGTTSEASKKSTASRTSHRTGAVRSSGVCLVLTLSPYSLKRMSRLPSTASSSAPTTQTHPSSKCLS